MLQTVSKMLEWRMIEVKRARDVKVPARVLRKMIRGQKRKGRKVRAMQKSICQGTQDLGQRG